jgi:predicted DNA-binding transcriptional regulator AlpA
MNIIAKQKPSIAPYSQPAQQRLEPADILTPAELASRLKVSKSWVFEQTRERAKVRNARPLPCIRLGKYLRFSWAQVSEWLQHSAKNA